MKPEDNHPLPKPNADPPPSEGPDQWAGPNVRAVIMNPVYAGVYPEAPRMISDEQWVHQNVRAIGDDGAEQWLVNLLYILRHNHGLIKAEENA